MAPPVQLAWGMEVVEEWSLDAPQAERNLVYEALLAVVDGTAPARYDLESVGGRFRLVVLDDLIVRGRFEDDAFGILFVGRSDDSAEPYGWRTRPDDEIDRRAS